LEKYSFKIDFIKDKFNYSHRLQGGIFYREVELMNKKISENIASITNMEAIIDSEEVHHDNTSSESFSEDLIELRKNPVENSHENKAG